MMAKKAFFIRAAAIALFALWGAQACAREARITLLHVNDVYEIGASRTSDGLAGLATLLKAERASHPRSLTVVAGDFLSPSLLSSELKGAQMVDLFNELGVDYVTFGNHEFDFGFDVLKQRMAESKFAWVSSNVEGKDGRPVGSAVQTAVREIDGVKIGFLGLTTRQTAQASNPGESVHFLPEIEAAEKAVADLEAQGARVIVAITHLDLADDRELAAKVKGINVILGGHEHVPITFYEHGVLINKTGSDAQYLGAVDLDVHDGEKSGEEPRVRAQWRFVANKDVAPEPAVAKKVTTYEDRLDEALDAPAGRTEAALDARAETLRADESLIGDLVADALRASLRADAALVNGGSIRGGGVIPAGTTLSKKDIFKLLPFGSTGVLLKAKGADILAAVENGLSGVERLAGRFPQVSGMTIVYDPRAKPGERVRSVLIGGKPLEREAYYRLATNDYVSRGGDGYTMLAGAEALTDPRFTTLIADMAIDYVLARKVIAPKIEGRMVAQ